DARGDQAADGTDRTLALDGESSPEQNCACGYPASPRHRAEQGGQENGIWLGLSDWSSGRGLSVWKADRGHCGRKADAAPGVGRVAGDLWPDGDTGVGGLRPRWRFDSNPPTARVGRRQGGGDSAQRESAVVGCRGSPGSDSQRAGSDRGKHWDVEKQPVQIQQTQGTSLANAGDGGSTVYLVLQSEQVHEGFGSAHLVRERHKRLDQSPRSCTSSLRVIPVARKSGTMLPSTISVRGQCYGIPLYILPAGAVGTVVVVHYAACHVAQRSTGASAETTPARRATAPALHRAQTLCGAPPSTPLRRLCTSERGPHASATSCPTREDHLDPWPPPLH